jgi:choice-of-anchor B domain-containing protein
MKYLLFIISIFLVNQNSIAQTPCENGMAGDYPCNGYDLQSFISLAELDTDRGNDSWGWTDPDNGDEYAIMGVKNGTVFIDISDPINPIYLGKLPTHTDNSTWRDIKVYQNYAFIVSEASNHGMQVFDLTRLKNVSNAPEIFNEDAHYDGFGSSHNIVINEETGYAYSVGDNTYSGGAHFIDISDPLNPIAAGGYSDDGYTHDAQVVIYNGPDTDYTGKEIYIGSNEDKVVIVDVTDKNNPQHISSVSYSNFSYTHQGWITEDFKYYILGDESDEINLGFNTKTIVLDFTDLDNPIHSFDYSGPTLATDHNGYVNGDLFYLANNAAGLRVIDISDISNGEMTEIGFFDSHPLNDFAGYEGIWSTYPYFESGNIVISDREGFLVVKSSTLAIEDNSFPNFNIYPNPTNNVIHINAIQFPVKNIKIYDLGGKLLKSKNYNSEINIKTNISNFSNGIYILKLNNEFITKIIKQ